MRGIEGAMNLPSDVEAFRFESTLTSTGGALWNNSRYCSINLVANATASG